MNTRLNIPKEFLNEEYRCDRFVEAKLKKIWAIELDLLTEFDKVCKELGLKYIAYGGTLLGAVRHHGFIPWDDDVDVCLTREDFEKLIKFGPEKFSHPYFLQTDFNDTQFFNGYARLRNSDTTGFITWHDSPNYNNGIFLDIYPLDGFCSHRKRFAIQMYKEFKLKKLLNLYFHVDKLHGFKKGLFICFKRFFSYNYLVKRYNKNLTAYNKKAKELTILPSGRYFAERYRCRPIDMTNVHYSPFEFIEIPIPDNADEVLRNTYGDYMKFPPLDERGKWHENKIVFDPDTPYSVFYANKNK